MQTINHLPRGSMPCGRQFCALLLAFFFAVTSLCAQNFSAGYDPALAEFVPGKIYVKMNPGFKARQFPGYVNGIDDAEKSEADFAAEIADYQISAIEKTYKILCGRSSNLNHFYTFTLADDRRKVDLMRALAARPEVALVERVPVMRTFCDPNDPDFLIPARSWHLQALNANGVWCSGLTGCSDVVIAIVDDAVRTTHEDLASQVAGQYDVTDGTFDANPPASATNSFFTHGTHVAGIAAAASDNSLGNASIGYNCRFYGIKTVADGSANPAILDMPYEGVEWAIAQGVDVINMSWGGYGGFNATHQALFTEAAEHNIVCVAAAGNNNLPFAAYPAAYNHVIGVGATAPGNMRACFSNYGTGVDIAAPGDQIWSTLAGADNAYGFLSGTSMASPMIAGITGLIRCAHPELTPTQIELCMINTSTALNNNAACNPPEAMDGQVSITDLAACDTTGFGNCPPEECELVRNGSFEIFDAFPPPPAPPPTSIELVDYLCGWRKAFSSPYVCQAGNGENYLALYFKNNDIERVISEEPLPLVNGQMYYLEFDYFVTKESPDRIIVCLTNDNNGRITSVPYTEIGFIEHPPVDALTQNNHECPPNPPVWHHYEGCFTYNGDGRLHLNLTGLNTVLDPPNTESICWFDRISIRPKFNIEVSVADSLLDCGECTQLTVETDIENPVIIWEPPTGLDDPTSAHPTACPEETTTYTVTVYDPVSQCTDTRSVTVTVDTAYWELECHLEHGYFCIVDEVGGSPVMQWISPFAGSTGHCQPTAGLNYGDPLCFVIYTFGPNGAVCVDTVKTVFDCVLCECRIWDVRTEWPECVSPEFCVNLSFNYAGTPGLPLNVFLDMVHSSPGLSITSVTSSTGPGTTVVNGYNAFVICFEFTGTCKDSVDIFFDAFICPDKLIGDCKIWEMATLPCCGDGCDLRVVVNNIQCYDSGTSDPSDDHWSFDILVSGGPGSYWETGNPPTPGESGAYGVTKTIWMGQIDNYGSAVNVAIFDHDYPECRTEITIPVPAPCSDTCRLAVSTTVGSCHNNFTPTLVSDDYYYVTLTVTGTNGQCWMAKRKNADGSEQLLGTFTGDQTLGLGPFLSQDGDWTLWVFLCEDMTCIQDVFIQAPPTCSGCQQVEISNIRCHNNGTDTPADDYWTFDILVTGGYGTFWHAGSPVNSSGQYGILKTINMGLISSYGASILFLITDNAVPWCTTQVVIAVPQPCSEACPLTMETRVGNCIYEEGRSVYYVTLTVSGSGGGCWTALQEYPGGTSVLLGTYTGDQTVVLGPFDPNLGDWYLTIAYCELKGCFKRQLIDAPGCFTRGESNSRTSGAMANGFEVYPSPANDELNIRNIQSGRPVDEEAPVTFQVFDLLGKPVIQTTLPAAGIYRLDVSSLQPGVYQLIVLAQEKVQLIHQFVKM